MAVLHTIGWFFYFFGYLIAVWPAMRRGLRALEKGDWATADALTARYVAPWASRMMNHNHVEITTVGRENLPDGPCVFVANHRSYYDIPLALTQLGAPHPLLSKLEADRIPLIRGWMRLLHCVFVDRSSPRASLAALHEAIDVVGRGYSMVIFPEGTRYKGAEGGIGEFKGGAFRIATKNHVPIVPVALSHTRALMEDNGNLMRPGRVTVRILPAIETAGLDRAGIAALPERCAELIRANLDVNLEAAGAADGNGSAENAAAKAAGADAAASAEPAAEAAPGPDAAAG